MPAKRRPPLFSLKKGAKKAKGDKNNQPSSDESDSSVDSSAADSSPPTYSSVDSLTESAPEEELDDELADRALAPMETDEEPPPDCPKIKLQSSDGVILEAPLVVVTKVSATIRNILESLPAGAEGEVMPLPKVRSTVLEKLLEWAKHHWRDKEPETPEQRAERDKWLGPMTSVKFYDVVSAWDEQFLSVDRPMLIDIMNAANYLNIKGLLDTACTFVAHQIRGRSTEEMRRILNIKSDFTPAEEARVRLENAFCEG